MILEFISSSKVKNVFFMNGIATKEIYYDILLLRLSDKGA